MSKVHKFHDSLAIGHAGEALVAELWPELTRTDGRKHDFYDKAGKLYELKIDSYDPAKTANFFIERYSSEKAKTDGGPWQSYKNGVDYYVYMFGKTRQCYIMPVEPLLIWLEDNIQNYAPIYINNGSYRTVGFKIEREKLRHLWTIKQL